MVSSEYLTLTASSFEAFGLTYVGTFTVSRPSGDVQVMRFTMTSGSLAGVDFAQACAGSVSTVTTATSGSLTGATFDAVSLAGTVGGTPVEFTVADPPTSAFPNDLVMQQVTLSATTMSADKLTMPSPAFSAQTC